MGVFNNQSKAVSFEDMVAEDVAVAAMPAETVPAPESKSEIIGE